MSYSFMSLTYSGKGPSSGSSIRSLAYLMLVRSLLYLCVFKGILNKLPILLKHSTPNTSSQGMGAEPRLARM